MECTLKSGISLTVRPACEDDAEAVISLIRQTDTESPFLAREGGEFTTDVKGERLFLKIANGKKDLFLVAVCEEKLIATCGVNCVRSRRRFLHRAQIGLSVAKAYWGRGVGSALMAASIDWAKEHGFEQMELTVVKGNERAIGLYKKFGFVQTGVVPNAMKYVDGTYVDMLLMIKNLIKTEE